MPAPRKRPARGHLRIIGGRWRSRRLEFTASEGLRPTTDRVRETLFNWLAPYIHGARCADLFAGSGALGLEALSRGATHCDFADTSGTAPREISKHLQTLGASENASCSQCSALELIDRGELPWDIVFIDPPFRSGLLAPVCQQLETRGRLAPGALVYIETGADETLPPLPERWHLHREKRAGGVISRLYELP